MIDFDVNTSSAGMKKEARKWGNTIGQHAVDQLQIGILFNVPFRYLSILVQFLQWLANLILSCQVKFR